MWDPEVVDSKVPYRDKVVLGSVNLSLIESQTDHGDPFPSCERVVQRVAELSAPDRDDKLRHLLQDLLDAMQVA